MQPLIINLYEVTADILTLISLLLIYHYVIELYMGKGLVYCNEMGTTDLYRVHRMHRLVGIEVKVT